MSTAIDVVNVSHRYKDREVLTQLNLQVPAGQLFVLLGPNGSGKSTLFRLISTLYPLQVGEIRVFNESVRSNPHAVRNQIGVVFQHPALDKKLTAYENLKYHAALFGISGLVFSERAAEIIKQLGLQDYQAERVEKLSGGWARRVELAKCLLTSPKLILMDEPTTGLDPTARYEFRQLLRQLVTAGTSILMTTHLLDEADDADQIAILDSGKIIEHGPPTSLRAKVAETIAVLTGGNLTSLEDAIKQRGFEAQKLRNQLRVELPSQQANPASLFELFPSLADSVTVSRGTLEDLYFKRTGKSFDDDQSTSVVGAGQSPNAGGRHA